ncbi:OLC1v1007333C1 [Oldenlandia corymbosa var. corymbosa]|uniref:OLC1v1007333C1 n=1 Tax=Oldenlandia corymbosa var. corymbosa TaxID=529605 RepID=A0AAV1DMD7_OLDCO|nr:OLC1v1007333C1 [Oldenlandia corymbosa var. corymbosa]
MENHHSGYPKIVLRVNINCCENCPKVLKKEFEEIKGVRSIRVEPEERLVYVIGEVDPSLLIKVASKKTNKKAEVVSYEKEPLRSNDHKVEDYVPPQFDESVCSDPHCKTHRSRPWIGQTVPPMSSADHPHHNAAGGFSGGGWNYFPGFARRPGYGGHRYY